MKLKNIVRYGAVAALMALTMAVMVSCQKQEPAAESEPTDTQLMQEAAGDAKAPFYVLVVGNDSRVGTTQISLEDYADGTGRSDTMMLVRVDPVTYKITLVTVPRDTEADYEGSVVKINELYRQGGMEAAVEGVESLTGVRSVLSRHGLRRLRELRQRAWRSHGERPHRHAFEGHRERRHH